MSTNRNVQSLKELAFVTINQIRRKQSIFTSQDRRKALQSFEAVVNIHDVTDFEIINAATVFKDYITECGHFGLRGLTGSNFLKHMNAFLKEAACLSNPLQVNKELELKSEHETTDDANNHCIQSPPTPPPMSQSSIGFFKPIHNEEGTNLVEEFLQKLDKKRLKIEDEISELLKSYYPNSLISASWNYRLINNTAPHEGCFFERFKTELRVNNDLQNKVDEYKSLFINNEEYKAWYMVQRNQEGRMQDNKQKMINKQKDKIDKRMRRAGFEPALLRNGMY